MRGAAVSILQASRLQFFFVRSCFTAMAGWAEYATIKEQDLGELPHDDLYADSINSIIPLK